MIPIPLIVQIGLGMFAVNHIAKIIRPKHGPQGPQGPQGQQGLQGQQGPQGQQGSQGQHLLGEDCIRNKNRIEDLSKQMVVQRGMLRDNDKEIDNINDGGELTSSNMERLMRYFNTSKSNNKKVNNLKEQHRSQSEVNSNTRVKVTKLIGDVSDSRGIARDTRKRLSILEEAMSKTPVGMITTTPKDELSGSYQQVNQPPQEK